MNENENNNQVAKMSNEFDVEKLKFINSLPAVELGKKLAKLNVITEVTADYLEMKEGEVIRAIYMGQTTFRTQNEAGEEIRRPAVLLRTDQGTVISAGTVLVNALLNLPAYVPVEIQNQGTKGQGTRKYADVKVFLLDMKI